MAQLSHFNHFDLLKVFDYNIKCSFQVCSEVLGGVMSDQKICKTCPHRYRPDITPVRSVSAFWAMIVCQLFL